MQNGCKKEKKKEKLSQWFKKEKRVRNSEKGEVRLTEDLKAIRK